MAVALCLLSIEYIRVNKIDGIELVEIDDKDSGKGGIEESVLVNKIDVIDDDKQAVQIYGTVVVWDCFSGDQIVYHRSWNNPESKRPGEYLSLTGPSVLVCANDPFLFTLCLWFHGDDESVKGGEIEGEIGWDMPPYPLFDQIVEEEISGKYGSVTVGYSLIEYALNATVNVVMMIPVAVYGTIKATTTFYNEHDEEEESLITRMLFDKSENECVQVSPQLSIPLTRPLFPVGVNSYLTIAVDLWDHDSLSPIALGSVEFDPIIGTTQKENITATAKYGELQVSFTCVYWGMRSYL